MGDIDPVGLIFLTGFLILPALGFTAAFVTQPLVRAIIELRKAFADTAPGASQARIAALEAEVRQLSSEVEKLADLARFDRQLAAGPPLDASGAAHSAMTAPHP